MWNETETIILTDLSININTLNPKIIVWTTLHQS
jgi:hypothetical protein